MAKLSLSIWRVEQTCNFVLGWGEDCQLTANLKVFPSLLDYYGIWQEAYLNFYRSSLRGRAQQSGSFPTPPVDWRVRLVQAEAELLSEFHRWLNSRDLIDIRQKIAALATPSITLQQPVDLFLSCNDEELARLPWETWEMGREFGVAGSIRLVRTPTTIRQETLSYRRQGKLRLLAIVGDDTGLDFQRDREALQSLQSLIDVTFVGWKQGKKIAALQEEIVQAIADPQGWDVLFFAGHSNETAITGGELAIAPHSSILLREIAPQLTEAKLRGLKFALFNSCKGISIANALIDLGLSQVAVMREPIHNEVAQAFLIAFVKALANYEDVHQAMRSACEYLKAKRNITFPSAALVPSLFQHPGAVSFRLEPSGLKSCLRRWGPTRREAIAVGLLAGLSLLLPVQRELIEQRQWVQAQFRHLTAQGTNPVSSASVSPPVLLVQIDMDSVADVVPVHPLNRAYLAQLIRQASQLKVSRLGFDYLVDRVTNQKDDEFLSSELLKAEQGGMKIIFATHQENGRWLHPHPKITEVSLDQLGDVKLFGNHQKAVLHANLDQEATAPLPLPFSRLLVGSKNPTNPAEQTFQTSWITLLSYYLHQTWLHPLIDYSLPPSQIYQLVSAKTFLKLSTRASELSRIKDQIVLIAAGYTDAGVSDKGEDKKKAARAMQFWLRSHTTEWVNGGEIHAYHIHHLMNQAFITPLPDFWFVGLAALLGKWGSLSFGRGRHRRGYWLGLAGGAGVYGLVSLQLYVTVQILLPWLLPVLVLGSYGLGSHGGGDRRRYLPNPNPNGLREIET